MSLDREWAVVLPNGQMLMTRMPVDQDDESETSDNPWMLPSYSFLFGGGQRPQAEPAVKIFPTQKAAQAAANQLRDQAKRVGVDDLLVLVVARWCSPWTTPDVGEQIAQAFVSYIESEPS